MNMDVNGCTTTRRLTGTTLKQVGIIPCMATQKRCKEEFAIHSDEDFTHYSSILFGSVIFRKSCHKLRVLSPFSKNYVELYRITTSSSSCLWKITTLIAKSTISMGYFQWQTVSLPEGNPMENSCPAALAALAMLPASLAWQPWLRLPSRPRPTNQNGDHHG